MAIRKPLVIVSGQVQELPAADTIDANTATKFPLTCDTIDAAETLTIPATYQYIVGGQINNSGTIVNDGTVFNI